MIELCNVSFQHDNQSDFVMSNIDLSIKKTGIYYLTGKNGIGKSTFALLLNGTYQVTRGQIKLGNRIVLGERCHKANYLEAKKMVGYVFQFPEHQLFEYTVRRELEFGLIMLHGKRRKEICEEELVRALAEVGLGRDYLDRNPFELSGGEQRRVVIAATLLLNTPILIFDEPTVGLDAWGKMHLRALLSKIANEKVVVVITHDFDFAYKTEGTYIRLYKDKVMVYPSMEEMLSIHPEIAPPQALTMKRLVEGGMLDEYKEQQLQSYMRSRGERDEK